MKIIAIVSFALFGCISLQADVTADLRFKQPIEVRSHEQISAFRPIVVEIDHAAKEPTRVEVIHRENAARKEEETLPEYFGAFSGMVASTSFILFDVFLGSLGISGYYVNYEMNYLIIGIGIVFGFLWSYSTYVRKKSMKEHIKSVLTTPDAARPTS